jgi:hypothetical protein
MSHSLKKRTTVNGRKTRKMTDTHNRIQRIDVLATRRFHPVKIRLDELTLEQLDLQRELDGAMTRSAFIRMVLTQYLAPLARQRVGMLKERDARMIARQDEEERKKQEDRRNQEELPPLTEFQEL